ncbi:MAG: hypothetical protein O2856_06320 [Planctomycetota bacterium]|nr:hypothetical protein [Planctomycetota bacterium]
MKTELDLIEKQLQDETPPLSALNIPDADALLTRFRRSRTKRRTFASLGVVSVLLIAIGYLSRPGNSPTQDIDVHLADDLRVLDHQTKTITASNSEDAAPTIADRTSFQDEKTGEQDNWIVQLGEVNEQGLIPMILSRQDGVGEATTVGFIEPPQVREVPLWQLPPQTQDAIYANWNEAGYQPKFGL